MLVMVVMLMVGGAVGEEHVHPVRDCFNNREQVLLRGFFAAGEIYDQRLSADSRRTAAQAAARRMPRVSRSMTARVASGVMSRCEKPVPPVVITRPMFSSSAQRISSS